MPMPTFPQVPTTNTVNTVSRCAQCWGTLPFGLSMLSPLCRSCRRRHDDDVRQLMADCCADDPEAHWDDDPADCRHTWPHFFAQEEFGEGYRPVTFPTVRNP